MATHGGERGTGPLSRIARVGVRGNSGDIDLGERTTAPADTTSHEQNPSGVSTRQGRFARFTRGNSGDVQVSRD